MISKVRSLGLYGTAGYEVSVECFLYNGLPSFEVVGLPDAAVKESRERVRAAVKSCGYDFPLRRIIVNLAPADTRKGGSLYDLPVLLSVLQAAGEIKALPEDSAFLGELSLEGGLRPVNGVLPMALAARKSGVRRLFVPEKNAPEAALTGGLTVYPVKNVAELLAHLKGELSLAPQGEPPREEPDGRLADFSEVKGQENAKRALEIAAAGGHNVLLVGPPGSGKSMLAKRLPSILPEMSRQEALEVTSLYSVAGLLDASRPLLSLRPFRAPHHSASYVSLTGGGIGLRPGEVSLAHNGVLFLDELPEFGRRTIEVLRQPLEDGSVTISRVAGTVTYPCRMMLVCAMNPCPCGWYGHPSGRCTCSQGEVEKYRARISGPLLDRIDLLVEVPALPFDDLNVKSGSGEPSAAIRARVNAARARQHGRGVESNAALTPFQMGEVCALDEAGTRLMRGAFDRLGLTGRSYDRVLRVARTIADLAGEERIRPEHLAEAIQYRTYDWS